jgi:hypothetical protein
MTAIELYTKREELIKSILTIDNEDLLNKLSQTIIQYRKKHCVRYEYLELSEKSERLKISALVEFLLY